MAPRGYTLKRRAESAAITRDRIVDAAASLYREHGVSATTIQAVAERADVARGTVVNHFGGSDGLLEAVLDRAVEEVDFPVPGQLEGAATLEGRIRRFVDVTFRFFDRSTDWWYVFAGDPEVPAVKARERAYWETFATFYGAAFGELAKDRRVGGAVRAFVDYGPLNALRAAGLTLDEAIDLVADALVGLARQQAPTAEEGSP
ncbi:MAG TPA: TetR/AcrR family transcriptional regulator [Candidatus Limnocylindrales bacterium]|nr:TetR/AcrR family transcriptional regulator [Candidatus Limnocylindrales bacterium]